MAKKLVIVHENARSRTRLKRYIHIYWKTTQQLFLYFPHFRMAFVKQSYATPSLKALIPAVGFLYNILLMRGAPSNDGAPLLLPDIRHTRCQSRVLSSKQAVILPESLSHAR